ncbi:hypothetical protein [Saccharothrix violaceirubra]|uniref:Uncharacterized protein n=1 Tax=Saccharothrix violaceirubra TaxID=413306 RepID=A0A7W7WT47_9PSEU|nr:hypothetical protein [Saccharothrix violaceirubra]MBB4962825.1 hypothetical protein [Saccharothrix violaceirubra]
MTPPSALPGRTPSAPPSSIGRLPVRVSRRAPFASAWTALVVPDPRVSKGASS